MRHLKESGCEAAKADRQIRNTLKSPLGTIPTDHGIRKMRCLRKPGRMWRSSRRLMRRRLWVEEVTREGRRRKRRRLFGLSV